MECVACLCLVMRCPEATGCIAFFDAKRRAYDRTKSPYFTFSQRLSNANFKANVYCKDDADVTYVDKPLEFVRNEMLTEPEYPESFHTEQVARIVGQDQS